MDELKKEILLKSGNTKRISYMQLIRIFKKFNMEINQFNFANIYPFLEANNILLIDGENTKKMILTK